jgi:hypothetical protein
MARHYYKKETLSVTKTTETGWVDIETNFWKTYVSGRLLMIRINSICSRRLFDYILDKMSTHNMVYNSIDFRRGFIEDCLQYAGITYHDSTVKNSFKELEKLNIITSCSRGNYIVNVECFSKLPDKDRRNLIIESKKNQKTLKS